MTMMRPYGRNRELLLLLAGILMSCQAFAQTNPLWTQEKVKNYLPHMTTAEVVARLTPFAPNPPDLRWVK